MKISELFEATATGMLPNATGTPIAPGQMSSSPDPKLPKTEKSPKKPGFEVPTPLQPQSSQTTTTQQPPSQQLQQQQPQQPPADENGIQDILNNTRLANNEFNKIDSEESDALSTLKQLVATLTGQPKPAS